jgi:hypothetical protein
MNKNEQNRVVAWRLKLLRQDSDMPGASPRPADASAFLAKPSTNGEPASGTVISKILYLRERYRFGPARITSYLHRFRIDTRSHSRAIACKST